GKEQRPVSNGFAKPFTRQPVDKPHKHDQYYDSWKSHEELHSFRVVATVVHPPIGPGTRLSPGIMEGRLGGGPEFLVPRRQIGFVDEKRKRGQVLKEERVFRVEPVIASGKCEVRGSGVNRLVRSESVAK